MVLTFLSRLKGLTPNFSFAELEKRYNHLFILLAITVIAYALVGLGYDGLSLMLLKGQTVRPAVEEVAPVSAFSKEPAEVYAVIPQRNLFGSTDKAVHEKQAETAAPVEGPDLATVLMIKGIVAGTGKDGFVVIEEQGKNKQMLYKVGNVVAGARLIRIDRRAVTFLIGERKQILKMAGANEDPLLTALPSLPPTATGRSGPLVVNRSEVDASLKDMGTLLSQAQIKPFYTDGAPDGFMISNIRPGSIYERLGLLNGDVVQAADGQKLLTADDVTGLYNTMKSASSFTLSIKRGGQQQNLPYVFH